jgi:hypothetical protein
MQCRHRGHRRLAVSPDRLSDILCHREQRHVGEQLTLAYDRKQLILDRSALAASMLISMTSRIRLVSVTLRPFRKCLIEYREVSAIAGNAGRIAVPCVSTCKVLAVWGIFLGLCAF